MATLVKITPTTSGREVLNAINNIRAGIGALQELDGQREQAIADSSTTMATLFGVESAAQAQALSDRWVAFLAAYNDSGNTEYAKLHDLLDPTFQV